MAADESEVEIPRTREKKKKIEFSIALLNGCRFSARVHDRGVAVEEDGHLQFHVRIHPLV